VSVDQPGYYQNKAEVLSRLRKIEGQIRGLQRLVEKNAYCIDILTQISAINKSLGSVGLKLFKNHLNHCIKETITQGDRDIDSKLEEIITTISRLVK